MPKIMTDNIIYQSRDVCVNYWAHLDEVDIFHYSQYSDLKGIKFDFLKRMKQISFVSSEDYQIIIKKINKIRLIENIDGF